MREARLVKSLAFMCFVCSMLYSCGVVHADYDVVLTGVNQFEVPVTYSNKSILISEGAFVPEI